MSYKDFFKEPENKKYIRYETNPIVKDAFEYMSLPENIDKMIIATNNNRPALEGIIEEVEKKFPNSLDFDLENDYTLRKALGSMVKYILSDFGYEVNIQKNISKGSYIKSATNYVYNAEKATKKIVKKVYIEEI